MIPIEDSKPSTGLLQAAVFFESELADILQLAARVLQGLDLHHVIMLACAFLVSFIFEARREIHRIEAERDNLMSQLYTTPPAKLAPAGISQDVLQEALKMAWSYSIDGSGGRRAGHILAIGPANMLLAKGFTKGRNQWECPQDPPSCNLRQDSETSILTKTGKENLNDELNQDGAHIIEGTNGQILAGKFFVSKVCSQIWCGGAGTAAAASLSSVMGSVVIKISQDGSVKEFRDGAFYHEYCTSRVAPKPTTLEV